jgi:hypothetical protein
MQAHILELPTRCLTHRGEPRPPAAARIGSRYRVPVAGILAAIGIPTAGDLTSAVQWSVDRLGAIRSTAAHDDTDRGEP